MGYFNLFCQKSHDIQQLNLNWRYVHNSYRGRSTNSYLNYRSVFGAFVGLFVQKIFMWIGMNEREKAHVMYMRAVYFYKTSRKGKFCMSTLHSNNIEQTGWHIIFVSIYMLHVAWFTAMQILRNKYYRKVF